MIPADTALLQGGASGHTAPTHSSRRERFPWPLPALVAGALGLLGHRLALASGLDPALAQVAAVTAGLLPALGTRGRWRRTLVGLCTPALLIAGGLAQGLPAWPWLLAAALLLLAYPVTAWRDAPFFPTRAGALAALPGVIRLGPHATLLDAGCGLGHGLSALRAVYPDARIKGVEHSLLLSLVCRLRCPWADVRRGDMWAPSWRSLDLVYLFQRPESMARAMDKARRELRPGAWLVSLEFEAEGWTPHARLETPAGKPLWIYRMPAPATRRGRAARR